MMRPATVLASALLLVLAAGPLAGPAMGQPHGEVTRVGGETVYVELDDSVAVDAGTVGRVIQEREVDGELVELTFAVLSVQEVERPVDGAWVAAAQITRQSRNLQAGDPVTFDSVSSRARLSVETVPPEATVYVDDDRVGTTPLRGPIGRGYHELRLERMGYRAQTRTFVVEAGEQYRFRDSLETAFGTLTVNSLPDSAAVEMGDRTLGTTPVSKEVQEDTYTLRVRQGGYLTYEDTVTVEGGAERQVNATLRRPLRVTLASEQVKEVTNTVLNREGDRLVLTYDLIGDAEAYGVELLLSTNGGKTFEPLPETVAGAVGEEVAPGEDKQVVWAAIEDFPNGLTGSGNRLRLSVGESGGNRLYWVLGGVLTAGAGTAAATLLGLIGGGDGGGGGSDDLPTSPPPAPN